MPICPPAHFRQPRWQEPELLPGRTGNNPRAGQYSLCVIEGNCRSGTPAVLWFCARRSRLRCCRAGELCACDFFSVSFLFRFSLFFRLLIFVDGDGWLERWVLLFRFGLLKKALCFVRFGIFGEIMFFFYFIISVFIHVLLFLYFLVLCLFFWIF